MILASSLLFSCWEFATRHPGILLVFIGVAGEVIFDWKEMKGKLAWAKRLSALVLIAGLILEFSEAVKSDKEVANTNLEAKQAETNAAASYERAGIANQLAAESDERSKQLEATNAQLWLRVAELVSTNLGLQKQVLVLNMQMQETTNKVATFGETVTETSNFINTSNTTARINEESNNLAELHKVTTDPKMAAVIEAVKPLEPFKTRLIDCLNSISPQFVSDLKTGTIKFEMQGMRSYDLEELQKLAGQPEGSSYIKIYHVGVMAIPGGIVYDVHFELSPDLLK